MPTRPSRYLAAALCLTAAACTQGSSSAKALTAADFTPGSCRAAAPGVLALRTAVRTLPTTPRVPTQTLADLTAAQTQLKAPGSGTDAVSRAALDLFQQAGYVRLLAVGNSYNPTYGARLGRAVERFITTCTTAPQPSGSPSAAS